MATPNVLMSSPLHSRLVGACTNACPEAKHRALEVYQFGLIKVAKTLHFGEPVAGMTLGVGSTEVNKGNATKSPVHHEFSI